MHWNFQNLKVPQSALIKKFRFPMTMLDAPALVHIQSTLNNTIVTLTDIQGNTLYWASCGTAGFQNSRKSTSYASQAAAERVAQYCVSHTIKKIHVKLKGLGSFASKESSLKGFQLYGIHILKIEDITPLAHNGCRLPKKRRL
jgi:small subunit ribosomal protein S11